ncbi:MAG TPA: hypothetical protein VIK91_24645, partial [Nannocystis sp.]
VHDPDARALVERHGLSITSLTWEDTARDKGSAYGPNISDMTIQVRARETGALTCMPVIRPPNFADCTCDLPLDAFYVLVGNERGLPLERVPLRAYLGDLRRFLTRPESWTGDRRDLLCERDTHLLVSAQACFLPVPREGLVAFNPVLFNYQSRPGNPAVLAVLVTREGTSATVIDNVRDAFHEGYAGGQRLFFNNNGARASLTGQRITDFVAEQHPGRPAAEALADARAQGLNSVLLLQIPLKHSPMPADWTGNALPLVGVGGAPLAAGAGASDVEEAVIGHGDVEGPFTEIDGLPIERDPRYPIRLTVQFYKATSSGVLAAADVAAIADQIARVYADARHVGSLVTGGATGRVTEWTGGCR